MVAFKLARLRVYGSVSSISKNANMQMFNKY